MEVIDQLRKDKENIKGMDLFNAFKEKIKDAKYQGRTSHLLLALFNPGYLSEGSGDDTGLRQKIYNASTGQPLNPPFREDQAESDLPPNLQIRRAIIKAIASDRKFLESQGG